MADGKILDAVSDPSGRITEVALHLHAGRSSVRIFASAE